MLQIFRLLSMLPLWLLHGLGWCLGWLVFLSSSEYRKRFFNNAQAAGVASALRRQAVGEAGKLVMELPRLWLGRPVTVSLHGEELINAALQKGKGVVFLTPHLGCFEVTAQAYAARFGVAGSPMTVLYRSPRKTWLKGLFASSRTRPGMKAAPANLSGVKQMLKALKQGHAVGLLPDQVPPESQGVWAPFFGRDAYTMTLSARLALQTGASVLIAWGERLRWGQGYRVHVAAFDDVLSLDVNTAALQVNQAMEKVVLGCPQQYLWAYARYKKPRVEVSA